VSASKIADSVGELLQQAAQRFGDKTALIFEDRQLSFHALQAASEKVRRGLVHLGIGPGDVVGLYAPNAPEWIIAYYAVMRLGGVVTPLNLMLTAAEAAHALEDSRAVAVMGSSDLIRKLLLTSDSKQLRHFIAWEGETPAGAIALDELMAVVVDSAQPPLVATDALCTIGYTSGTTGHPKGAMLSHLAILTNAAMTATMHLRTDRDVVISALPCSHVYGNIVMNSAIAQGMTLILFASFDAQRTLQAIQTHRATMFEGVPTMYMYMLNHPGIRTFDLSSLTRCTVGGQTMPDAKMRQVEEVFGCPLLELWGMTELGGLGTTHSAYGPRRHGSIGVPLPHLEARIASTERPEQALAYNEVGELQIRGPVTMTGYLGHPEATAKTLLPGGWLRTGDLARQDAAGYFYVVDRLKDMIITGGFNIYPAELERVVAQHPDVAMVAVTGVHDEIKGELAKAFVVRRLGAAVTADQLDTHCRMHLAAYKVPRAFAFVDDLPKTSGKILRRALRELAVSG
jgi:long-chain acyl-CoA synthetase